MTKPQVKTGAPPPSPRAKTASPRCFVDAHGGAFAALAAGVARAGGQEALAATTSKAGSVPAEIGAAAPEVTLASALPSGAERVDVSAWGTPLYAGEGELEHLSSARIARDRIERRLAAS
jgi:hypothetical protein